jgi:hypothetical protein
MPVVTNAQDAASFDDVQRLVKLNQQVVVTDAGGGKTRGNVVAVTPTTIIVRVDDVFAAARTRTFDRAIVSTIRRSDRLWNGILIGVGAGFAATEVWSYNLCGARGTNAECTAIASGVGWVTMVPGGAVVGALIDKAIGNHLIYTSRANQASLRVSPSVTPRRASVAVTVAF